MSGDLTLILVWMAIGSAFFGSVNDSAHLTTYRRSQEMGVSTSSAVGSGYTVDELEILVLSLSHHSPVVPPRP
jgi:hypothetical protein